MANSTIREIRNATDLIYRMFRQMVDRIIAEYRRMTSQLVILSRQGGQQAAQSLTEALYEMVPVLQQFFIGGKYDGLDYKFWEWGFQLMLAFAAGIRHGKDTVVDAALDYIAKELPASTPEHGPLAFEPDWSYITAGLAEEFDAVGRMINGMGTFQIGTAGTAGPGGPQYHFERGAFAGATIRANNADELLRSLDDITERSVAFSRVGGAF